MNKIQFYPDDDLYEKLEEMSKDCGISISALVQDFLRDTLCLEPRKTKGEVELTKAVLSEVSKFIKDKDYGFEFDLMTASPTFASIKSLFSYESTGLKTKVGRNFAKKIADKDTSINVAVALNRNGNKKRNQHNAIVYKVVEIKD